MIDLVNLNKKYSLQYSAYLLVITHFKNYDD
ncbi:hypothetical protein ABIB40_002816 [Pedobacter sp. UYP30]